jgi:hypothetical protein
MQDVLRQMQDRCEIEALMWRYVRTLDQFDADAYPDLYAPDGMLGEGAGALHGREALRGAVLALKQRAEAAQARAGRAERMHHVITNTCIEFIDRDTARMNYYWMQVFAAAPGEGPPRVASAGRGVDVLTRVDGRWLIRQRIVTPDD